MKSKLLLILKKRRKRKNSYEVTIESLKAELYDKGQEILKLKNQMKKYNQVISKVRALPPAKKKELGL